MYFPIRTERHKDVKTEEQTDIKIYRQKDKQTNKPTNYLSSMAGRQALRWCVASLYFPIRTERHKDVKTERQTDIKMYRQTNKQTNHLSSMAGRQALI